MNQDAEASGQLLQTRCNRETVWKKKSAGAPIFGPEGDRSYAGMPGRRNLRADNQTRGFRFQLITIPTSRCNKDCPPSSDARPQGAAVFI